MTVDPNTDAWWHSPEMVAGLWSFIVALMGAVGYLLKQWWDDRSMLREVKDRLDSLDNGTTFAEVRSQVHDIHDWWMEHVKKH